MKVKVTRDSTGKSTIVSMDSDSQLMYILGKYNKVKVITDSFFINKTEISKEIKEIIIYD